MTEWSGIVAHKTSPWSLASVLFNHYQPLMTWSSVSPVCKPSSDDHLRSPHQLLPGVFQVSTSTINNHWRRDLLFQLFVSRAAMSTSGVLANFSLDDTSPTNVTGEINSFYFYEVIITNHCLFCMKWVPLSCTNNYKDIHSKKFNSVSAKNYGKTSQRRYFHYK